MNSHRHRDRTSSHSTVAGFALATSAMSIIAVVALLGAIALQDQRAIPTPSTMPSTAPSPPTLNTSPEMAAVEMVAKLATDRAMNLAYTRFEGDLATVSAESSRNTRTSVGTAEARIYREVGLTTPTPTPTAIPYPACSPLIPSGAVCYLPTPVAVSPTIPACSEGSTYRQDLLLCRSD